MLFFFGLAVVLVGLFLIAELSKQAYLSLLLKTLASFGFVQFYVSILLVRFRFGNIYNFNQEFLFFFLLGLICGLIGDVLLGLRALLPKEKDSEIILSGMAAFSLGHIFYILALMMLTDYVFAFPFVFSIVVTLIVIGASFLMKYNWKKLMIPSIIYSLLIFFMIGEAIVFCSQSQFNLPSVLLMVGAILFGISDLILSMIYFKGKTANGYTAANLLTYYAAQLLIGVSIYFLVL